MKKIHLGILVIISSISSMIAQDLGVSIHFSSKGAIGATVDGVFNADSKMVYGIAMLFYGSEGVGTDYSQVFGPAAYQEERYEIVDKVDQSIYGVIGYRVTSTIIVKALIGGSSSSTYYNGYDRSQILDPSGYYYTSTVGPSAFAYGIQASVDIHKGFTLETGYTTQDGISLGIGIRSKV